MSQRMEHIERRLDSAVGDIADVRAQQGSILAHLRHTATKAWVLGGVVAVLLSLFGAVWWLAQQYLQPLLAASGTP